MSDVSVTDFSIPRNVYRCDAGHETVVSGKWVPLMVVSRDGAEHAFHFCWECFGMWAAEKWPTRKVEPS